MKRKIMQRNKRKYTALMRSAHSNEMTLKEWVELVRRLNQHRHDDREGKRYGRYTDWDSAEFKWTWLCVPHRSCKNWRVLSYSVYSKLSDLPEDKQAMYQAQFMAKEEGALSEGEQARIAEGVRQADAEQFASDEKVKETFNRWGVDNERKTE